MQLVKRHGINNFENYIEYLHDYAEKLMRAEIIKMPNGVYEFEDWLDGLGDKPEPVRFKTKITIDHDNIKIDWGGTSLQLKAAINTPLPTTNSMAPLAR